MTATLAPRTGLPGTPHDTGITLPPDLTFEEWERGLHLAERIERASPWWVCDLIAYGQARFGELHAQALPTAEEDPSGVRQAKLKQAGWMADKFPPGTRVPTLSYTHHRIVAELPPAEAQALLREAAGDPERDKPPLSTRELIALRDRRREDVRGRVVAADGEPVETPDLPWSPGLDDLSDDARASISARAPQGSKRSAWIAGAIFALVWAGCESAFRDWRGA